MDWQGIAGSAGQQNAIFWGGAAAVALGFTLLVATLATRLRRRLRRPFAMPRIPARQAAVAYQAAGTSQAAADPQGADASVSALALAARVLAENAPPPAPSLAILLRRLQLAGDRLEEVAQAIAEDDEAAADMGLKEDALDVEYVFKACSP
jgi:hypothetical protein